jgi:hypothetical protein
MMLHPEDKVAKVAMVLIVPASRVGQEMAGRADRAEQAATRVVVVMAGLAALVVMVGPYQ